MNASVFSGLPATAFTDAALDPRATLDAFTLEDLAPFKREKAFPVDDALEYRTFYVGRDDVHGVLKYLLARCSRVCRMNMFGFDDEELSAILEHLVTDDGVYVQGTLDKSQAAGVHEAKILAAWDPQMRASFAIGRSVHGGQISHTKGGTLDGRVAFEGSTNWSATGEGINPLKAQNNTLLVHVNPVEVLGFSTELDVEHTAVLAQQH